jgi:hypothetical protein
MFKIRYDRSSSLWLVPMARRSRQLAADRSFSPRMTKRLRVCSFEMALPHPWRRTGTAAYSELLDDVEALVNFAP